MAKKNLKNLPDVQINVCQLKDKPLHLNEKDAKIIMRRKPWKSKKYSGDSFQVQTIINRNQIKTYWLLQIDSISNINGERTIIPMYEVELVEKADVKDKDNYFYIKRK
jgi:hypothetical protein